MTTAAIEATVNTAQTHRLSTLLRTQVESYRARRELGLARVRQVWSQLGERLRAALALPTKQEMGELNERLSRLEKQLARLSSGREKTVAEKRIKKPAATSSSKARPKAQPF